MIQDIQLTMHEDIENTENTYWQAVLDRNSGFDGSFVYAVRTTGVYCHPSCGARHPRREHVTFFTTGHDAQSAGYRPCKRCRPDTDAPSSVALVQQMCRYIETHSDESLSLAVLSEQFHLSPFHLQRLFKRIVGVTPRQYVQAQRMERLKAQLKTGDSITEAVYEVGYSSSSRVYEQVPTRFGMTPTSYRRGGKGMQIAYTIVDCPLGRLIVARTERGLCAVCLGESDAVLEAALVSEYPAATIERNAANLTQDVCAILQHLEGKQPDLDLPLDVQATAFQQRVWDELRSIPYGETRSYRAVAQALGDPNKARAVAQACAHNPTALVVPCHRVVREDGSMGGYRWNVERKQRLLEQESRIAQSEEIAK